MFRSLLIAISILLMAGCATITGNIGQPITVLAVCAGSSRTVEAECVVSNDSSRKIVTTPGTVLMPRSFEPLSVHCKREGASDGKAELQSSSNAQLVENIVFGGIIGVAVDAGTGAGFDYPEIVTLLMDCPE